MQAAGYSATPLAKKLGIKPGFSIRLINQPAYYQQLFDDWPQDVVMDDQRKGEKDFIHFFTMSADELFAQLPFLRRQIKPAGMIWVSWPKKASKMPTDITEDVIRNYALKIGLVDVKVCALDAVWSGLKLVIPVKMRSVNGESS